MTREEAILIISGDVLGTTEQTHEAVAMAVEALKRTEKHTETHECDYISRQAAIGSAISGMTMTIGGEKWIRVSEVRESLYSMPSAQPTLYGYKIEHLAYIARVMQKEGVTAEYAVRTFDDISRAIRMIIDEAQQKTEEMLNERFNKPTGGD